MSEMSNMQVRTKDIDCVLSPHTSAVVTGQGITEGLLAADWKHRTEGEYGKPGTADTPDDELPVIRLHPPDNDTWFLELLTEPTSTKQKAREFERIRLSNGDYGLPSFRFTRISVFEAAGTEFGIRCAKPEMMVLANLFENQSIKPDLIKGSEFHGHQLKRSNKDLGRVLSIARLTSTNDWEKWIDYWEYASKTCFPDEWRNLVKSSGSGLRELLNSETDFQEAYYSCINSLLGSSGVTPDELKITGERLLTFTIEPFEALAE
ncbi:MAG: hypothetical protein P9L92_15665 [Candidatus Electryonea clarkiae]|nr:hypothetical protein [Candidatus Electryonea clarkiae]MDP8287262.1 hypothetical protein [Candidatus Electryonea clarkiae]